MEDKQKVIKIDCDGVLRDLLSEMCITYNNYFKENIKPENVIEYDLDKTFTKCLEIDGITAIDWFMLDNGIIINNSNVLPKAKEAMDILHEKGYYIIIVTYQKHWLNKNDTTNWLAYNNIYYDSICFTNKKNLIKGDIIVDDNIDFLKQCDENNERLICIDAAYNIGKHTYEHYKSLYDFALTL